MKLEQSEALFIKTILNEEIVGGHELLEDYSLDRLTGDASTRRYYRAYDKNNSYVICLDTPTTSKKESDFYSVQKVLEENNVPVPKVYSYRNKKGLYLEEDLGDETLLLHVAKIGNDSKELDLYRKVVEILLSIHKVPLDNYSKFPFAKRGFDLEKLRYEYNFTKKYFIKKLLNSNLTLGEEKVLDDYFNGIFSKLIKKKFVLTHRDYHSRNIMVKGNQLKVIDFQDAMLGLPQYDLCSLLDDCYYDLSEENKEKLKKYYFEKGHIKDQTFEEFLKLYDLMLIQRAFKAIGSFSYIYEERKDIRYLRYIGFTFEKVRKTIMKIDAESDALKLLNRLYYEH